MAEKTSSEKALAKAVNFIKFRPRSIKEVKDKLRTLAFDPATIQETLDKLAEYNLLDDAEFARLWSQERLVNKKFGLMKVKNELKMKGIDENIIREVLDIPELDETESAADFLRNKFRRGLPQDDKSKAKALALLGRNGFNYSTAKKALVKFLDSEKK